MSSLAQNRIIVCRKVVILTISLLAIFISGDRLFDHISRGALNYRSQLPTATVLLSAAFLMTALFQVQRERAKRAAMNKIMQSQYAELAAQHVTADLLAQHVEAARTEVIRRQELLADLRAQERLSDLSISEMALGKEVAQREEATLSLRSSQSELLLARDGYARDAIEHTQELVRSNHELEQFAYVASHDLQEPLRAISGCVQILEKRYFAQLDDRGRELIAHTVAGAARLHELIEGLLAYSRVSRRAHGGKPTSTQRALSAAQAQLESAIGETAAVLTIETELPTVLADPGQLVQLLQNLISNAIKYRGAETPRIGVSAEREGNFWRFRVSDNGIGVEPQYFDRIFAIFQRLHTRDEYPGTGIGLAICRRIVQQAGGTMWLESDFGKGSRFFFTLPAVAAP